MDDQSTMEKVGVFMLGSLGDTITTIPALRAIVRATGSAKRIVIIHDRIGTGLAGPKDILPSVLGIQHYVEYDAAGAFSSTVRLLWQLRRARLSDVFYLAPAERTPYQVARDRWFFRAAGVHRLIGFYPFSATELYPAEADGRPARVPPEAHWRLERLRRAGIPVDPDNDVKVPYLTVNGLPENEAVRWLAAHRRYPDRPLIALCPGGKQKANLWAFDRWVSLARSLVGDKKIEIVIVGGVAEEAMGRAIVQEAGEGISAAGALGPLASAALLHRCELVVGLDSGAIHLAAAGGTRCLVLFGAREHPGRWYPIGPDHIILRHDPPCAGCRARECPLPSHPCMTAHTTHDVLAQIRALVMLATKRNSK